MKNAVYYARVSTSLQEEKGTIDSQKNELKQQIKADGNVLVGEYVDNGWSGARLDRPDLDRLLRDVKTDLFDTVYFLDSDRIARDVSYQNIIVADLLKYKKEIIIKGKNYIHNPENKFNLTVLGAVNELEKTRILERFMRGRREKARKGHIVDNANPLGYNHIKKTDEQAGRYEINTEQAEIVRFIFETYAHTDISLNGLVRLLEKKGIKTSSGKTYWKSATVHTMLKNTTYYGLHYFNRTEKVESLKEKEKYAKSTKTRTQLKEKDEWIKMSVPPIISEELFNKVQLKLSRNRQVKRGGGDKYKLSGIIKCGVCNHTYSGTEWKGVKYYKCNHRDKRYNHVNREDILDCKNKAVNSAQIENLVNNSLQEKILRPEIIKKFIGILQANKETDKTKSAKRLRVLDELIGAVENRKKRVLDLRIDGTLEKELYVQKTNEMDKEKAVYTREKEELVNKLSLLAKKKEILRSIDGICERLKKNYSEINQGNQKLIFRDLIKEVVLYKNGQQNKVIIHGHLPLNPEETALISTPSYCIGNSGRSMMRRTKRPGNN